MAIINPFVLDEDPTTNLREIADLIIADECNIVKEATDKTGLSSSLFHISIKGEIINITSENLAAGRKVFAAKLFDKLGIILGDAPYQDWHIFFKFIADNVNSDEGVV